MGKLVFIIYLFAVLTSWDLSMKLRDAVNRNWARRYLDRRLPQWCRQLFSVASLLTGFRVEYSRATAERLRDPVLVIANHQSLIDIVAVRAALGEVNLRFVAKHELRRGFVGVSQALRLQRHALIRRSGRVEEGLSELTRLARMAKHDSISPVVFPEGTRSRTRSVMRFRTGALRIILNEAPMPLVVCAVDGGYRLRDLRAVAGNFGRGLYRVRILAKLPAPTTRAELNNSVTHAENLIREQIEHWHHEDMNA